jgi:hypothetical protein
MSPPDRLKEQDLQRLWAYMYLVPMIGFFPALWALYRGQGNRHERNASRLAVTLALGWLVGYLLLGSESQTPDSNTLSWLIGSALLTSGYFLTSLWLMVRLWQRQPLRLPGLSRLSDRLP